MMQSKYGKHSVKFMLKCGLPELRRDIIKQFYGHVTKLTSHIISAPIFEYAYTIAESYQRQELMQEYFGEIYKSSKDDHVYHLKDVYKDSPEMKAAALSATKANLLKVLNKNCLDSTLVQSVLEQFLSECSEKDKAELVPLLIPYIAVISNSKDGAKAAMQCIWSSSAKERKSIMKDLKEHLIDLSKHEHGYRTVITLLDVVDDTVLLNKIILSELFKHAQELVVDSWGRRVIFWLVLPGGGHVSLLEELEKGRLIASSKKPTEIRRKEILEYSIPALLESIAKYPKEWLANGAVGMLTLAVLERGIIELFFIKK